MNRWEYFTSKKEFILKTLFRSGKENIFGIIGKDIYLAQGLNPLPIPRELFKSIFNLGDVEITAIIENHGIYTVNVPAPIEEEKAKIEDQIETTIADIVKTKTETLEKIITIDLAKEFKEKLKKTQESFHSYVNAINEMKIEFDKLTGEICETTEENTKTETTREE